MKTNVNKVVGGAIGGGTGSGGVPARVRYKSPASVLWVENELRKRDRRIDTLQKQNTRITLQNNRLLAARKRYDVITVEQRKDRERFHSKMWRRVDVMWQEREQGRPENFQVVVSGPGPGVAPNAHENCDGAPDGGHSPDCKSPGKPVNPGDMPDAGRMNRF